MPLEGLGYIFRAENPERTKRYFREAPGQRRTHIHVRRWGSWAEQFALLFRDYLRVHPDDVKRYAALKYSLAERYGEDRHAYTEAKAPLIWEIIMTPSQWIRLIITYLLIPIVLLICGWDFGWWQAWVFSLLIVVSSIAGRIWAERRHPGLLAERAKFEKAPDVKPWDKVLAPLMAVSLSFPLAIVAGLDHRFGWSPVFPTWLNILGFILIELGYAFAVWALVENRYFSGVVRIQTERGHTVCASGPYRIVRHPGYAGNILPLPGIVLALGSVWTIIPATVALIITVIRTALEDRTLQEELPGYRDYARRVRYRLIPGIY